MNKQKILFIVLAVLIVAYFGFTLSPWFPRDQRADVDRLSRFIVLDNTLDDQQIAIYENKFNQARDVFLQRQGTIDAVGPLIDMGVYKQLVGDYKGAEAAWKASLDIDPESTVASGNLAHLYYYFLHDNQKAEEYYQKAIAKPGPNLYTYYAELYELYRYQFKDMSKAEATLTEAIDKVADTQKINALLLAADYFREIGDKGKARSYYQRMLEINPDSSAALVGLQRLDQ